MLIRAASAADFDARQSVDMQSLTSPATWQPRAPRAPSLAGDCYVMVSGDALLGVMALSKISPDTLAVSLLEVARTAPLEQVLARFLAHASETARGTDIRRLVIRCDPTATDCFTAAGADPIAELPPPDDRSGPLVVLELRLPTAISDGAAAAP